MSTHDSDIPCVLAIGGLDPSGGAGLPSDARAMAAFGAHCCGITTAVIAQNTRGVVLVEPVSPLVLDTQLDALLSDVAPRAIKIGMLPSVEAVEIVEKWMRSVSEIPLIVDTVFAPTQGWRFCDAATIRAITERLLPLSDVVTPNIPEAVQLSGTPITDAQTLAVAVRHIHKRCGARHVLVKGGHWPEAATGQSTGELEAESVDTLFDGQQFIELRARRVLGYEVRGTGCLLASAIAAQRARGLPVEEAARGAKTWLTRQILNAKRIGHGRRVATLC
jgi:hydroxymethylpyrimidine/phosphomethylpyrimidine kinase